MLDHYMVSKNNNSAQKKKLLFNLVFKWRANSLSSQK